MNKLQVAGDSCHAASIVLFYSIAAIRGNAAGLSLKAQELYLIVFVTRYMDLWTDFYSWYNSMVKVGFIVVTAMTVYTLRYVEPAKSTYSATQDAVDHWSIVASAAIGATIIHLIGSGTVDIKGGSGEELEVHLERYEFDSFLWTFSICLEPFAMMPQQHIFRNNRQLNQEIQVAMLFKAMYRVIYMCNWLQIRKTSADLHILVYCAGVLQTCMYIDFFLFHIRKSVSAIVYSSMGYDADDEEEEDDIETIALQPQNQNPEGQT